MDQNKIRFRIILLSGVAIVLYLVLSLYHGHLLRQLPDIKAGKNGAQKDNWVQVTTSTGNSLPPPTRLEEQQEAPAAPAEGKRESSEPVAGPPVTETWAPDLGERIQGGEGSELARVRHDLALEQRKTRELAQEKENLLFKINALQQSLRDTRDQLQVDAAGKAALTELETARNTLRRKTKALNEANERISSLAKRLEDAAVQLREMEKTAEQLTTSMERERQDRKRFDRIAARLQGEADLARQEAARRTAENGKLQSELKKMRSRLLIVEEENRQTRLKAEAMFHYGQEQSKLSSPYRQENELFKGRLLDAQEKLLAAEQTIARLEQNETALQQQLEQTLGANRQNEAELARLEGADESLSASNAKIAELSATISHLEEQLATHEQRATALTGSLAEAQSALQAAGDKAAADSATQQRNAAQAKELQRQLAGASQALTATQEELARVLEQNKALVAAQQTSSGELAVLKDREVKQQAAIDAGRQQIRTLESMVQEKDAEVVDLHQKLEEQSRQGDMAASLKDHLQGQENLVTELQTRITVLQQQVAEGRQQLDDAVAEQSSLVDENKAIAAQLAAAEETIGRQSTLTGEIALLHEQLAESRKKASGMAAELDRREEAYFNLQEELSILQQQHDTTSKERDRLLRQATDSDGDGVADSDDSCPETIGGVEVDDKGCEKDSDKDGLVDRLDLCPASPEGEATGPIGCPPDSPVILADVSFASGTAHLSPNAASSLNSLVAILQNSPALRIEIGGHTDSIGEPERNLTVSRERAEAVAAYLVNGGIDPARVEAAGFGSQYPVADNATPAGRAANRRVELRIIGQSGE